MIDKKWCWLATEVKEGWRLKLCYGSNNHNLTGMIFKTIEDVEEAVIGNIVYIHLKHTKFPVK